MEPSQFLIKIKSEKVVTALSAAFLLSFSVGFFGPALLYYTNFFDFSFKFSDIFVLLLLLSLLTGILLFSLLLLFKGNAYTKAVSVVFATGTGFYIQGNILVWNYGYFDGHAIIWNNYLLYGFLELLIWFSVILLSYLKADKVIKIVTLCSIFLLFIQSFGLITMILHSPREPQWKSYSFDSTGNQFDFSSKENVIIIVLDTFQSDVFQEIVNEDMSYEEIFSGFTYYRNAVGGYPRTVAAVPLIMTGTYYRNELPFDDFVQYSYKNSSLTKTLSENDFDVLIHENARLVFPEKNVVSNVKSHSLFSDRTFNLLYGASVFRFLPHFIKEISYPFLISQVFSSENYPDLSFYNTIQNQTKITTEKPIFQFYHLNGPHYPFILNESLTYKELPDNREGYKEQSKASLQIVAELLNELKEDGIYDKSFIIVIGDHGMQNNAYAINISQIEDESGAAYTPNTVISGGIPLVLVKPFNSNASLGISDVPVALSDIPKTITTELNIPNSFTGNSMLGVQDSDQTERLYYHYTWDAGRWDNEFLPALQEYSVTNFSWYGSSWQPDYKTYTSHGLERSYPPSYNLNSTIKIGKNEGTDNYFTVGWSKPEEYFAWSEEKSATIAFSMNNTYSDLLARITYFPLTIDGIYETHRVRVFINKKEIGNYTLSDKGDSEKLLYIPREFLNEHVQYLSFIFPDAKSPNELGVSDDKRKISIGLTSFGFEMINPSNLYFDDHWSPVENWSGTDTRWLNDNAAISIFSDQNRTINLSFEVASLYRTKTLDIYHNNQEVNRVPLSKNFSFVNIPLLLREGENKIHLSVDGGCDRPSDIPEMKSSDSRCLGIAVQNVKNTL